jgi:hypothetical protein
VHHRDSDGRFVLRQEDLSSAPQPPWSLDHFINTANHLGQFNGYHFVNKTELPINVSQYACTQSRVSFAIHSSTQPSPAEDPSAGAGMSGQDIEK